MRRKLIVVSNRGPVSFGRDDAGEPTAKRGGGGLVTALRSLLRYHDVTWIASAISEGDRSRAGETFDDTGQFCFSGQCRHNAGGAAYGGLNLVNAIRVSSDNFFYNLGVLTITWLFASMPEFYTNG